MRVVLIALVLVVLPSCTKRVQVISLGPLHDASAAADGSGGSDGSGGTSGTGGADAHTAPEAAIETAIAAETAADGGACTTLANTAPAVPVTTGDDTVATGAGGTVAAGTYYLTAIVRTPASVLPQMTFRQTLWITGNTVAMAADDSDKPAFTKTSTFTTSGASIVFTRLCSTEADSLTELQYDSYTADDAHLILYGATLGITVTYTRLIDGGTGGADAGTAPEAATDGKVCTTLANTAPVVPVTTGDDTVATGVGGTVVAGTYYLTSIVRTPSSIMPQMTAQQTLRISGSIIELATQDSDKPAYNGVTTFTTRGSSIVFTSVCSTQADASGGPLYDSYTADDFHLILYSTTVGITVTYTRQS